MRLLGLLRRDLAELSRVTHDHPVLMSVTVVLAAVAGVAMTAALIEPAPWRWFTAAGALFVAGAWLLGMFRAAALARSVFVLRRTSTVRPPDPPPTPAKETRE